MRRARDVIGLPVMCLESGKQAGEVKDLLLDEKWLVRMLLLETKHWYSDPMCIRAEDVAALGEDAVMIPCEEVIAGLPEEVPYRSLICGDCKVKGIPVLTANGRELGIVEDVYLQADQGIKVIGYELSEGFLTDLREGRKWLPLPDSVKAGEDVLIVPVHASDTLQEIFESKEE
ncbi:PRC-barrel domain-containing protein [Paenibacillus sp. S-38]|uniref:PRC-barrel domain-containing protein n=1 Tax=Paenibacillus sp. S-38 TaxID=3416710 RepID=UPI003CFA6289